VTLRHPAGGTGYSAPAQMQWQLPGELDNKRATQVFGARAVLVGVACLGVIPAILILGYAQSDEAGPSAKDALQLFAYMTLGAVSVNVIIMCSMLWGFYFCAKGGQNSCGLCCASVGDGICIGLSVLGILSAVASGGLGTAMGIVDLALEAIVVGILFFTCFMTISIKNSVDKSLAAPPQAVAGPVVGAPVPVQAQVQS